MVQAAELHDNPVAVHPFTDGNGRTARLVMNNALLRCGYPHTIMEVTGRAEWTRPTRETGTVSRAGSAERSIRRELGQN